MDVSVEIAIRRLLRNLKYQYLVIATVVGAEELHDYLNETTLDSMRTPVH